VLKLLACLLAGQLFQGCPDAPPRTMEPEGMEVASVVRPALMTRPALMAAPALMATPTVRGPRDPLVGAMDGWHVDGPTTWDSIIVRSARQLPFTACDGIPAAVWVKAQIMQESSGDPNAVSETGCTGLMQICRALAKDEGVADRTDPAVNVQVGVKYLDWQYDQWPGVPPLQRTCEQRLPLAHSGFVDGLGEVLHAQRVTMGNFYEELRPALPPQGQHYHPAIRARIVKVEP